ncbi:unnamed protein product [Parnassius mnemosyne]|uniref:Transposase n=1 Tax=Parnassius mnemosyne TaxID=213953 RepID=A0AAV1KL85_9NEOP
MDTSKPKSRKKARKSRRRLGARQYKNYSNEMLEIAVDLVRKKQISAREAARQFAIPKQTILNKVNKSHTKSVGCPTRLSDDEEAKFIKVLIAAGEFGCPLSKLDLRLVVFEYLKKNGREDVFNGGPPGKAWLDNFLSRHSLDLSVRSTQNIKKNRAEKGVDEFMEYFRNLEETLKDVAPSNILNFDETNLTDDPGSSKCIFRRGVKYPERVLNSTKGAISLMFSVTANGSLLPIYVVYKAENLYSEWIQGGPRGTRYNCTRSGWFDSFVFEDYFNTIIMDWAKSLPSKKVVICDNLSSHLNVSVIELCECHNIQFVFIPSSSTHITQPLDVAFFAPLKKVWRAILLKYKMENPNQTTLNKNHFPKLLHSLVDQVEIYSSKNIKSGFRATGIYPFIPREVLKRVPEYQEDVASYGIDNALLDYLKQIRQPNPMITKRNKKVMTVPGKSVTVDDLLLTSQLSKSNVRGKVKSSKNTTTLTKVDTAASLENFNKNYNYDISYILNEKKGLMEATKNTDLVFETDLPVISIKDQDKPKKINILSDIILPKYKTKHIAKTKTKYFKEIDTSFNILSQTFPSERNIIIEKPHSENSGGKVRKIDNIAFNINVHGVLSSDDNEDIRDIVSCSANSREKTNSKKRKKKRRLRKTVKKENVKPVKRPRKSLDSSTTTEEDCISTHSDSDVSNFEISMEESTNIDESINMDKQIIKEDIHQIDKNSKKKEYYELGEKVLVRYHQSNNWKYYVGLIESVNDNSKTFNISYYKCIKTKDSDDIKFIKPKLLDRDIAVPESNIVKIIELLQFNESPEEYALMCDKDSVYF